MDYIRNRTRISLHIYSMFTRDITVNKRKRKKAKEKRKGTKREFNRNQTNASV